jgi:hypothetical protein
MEPTGSVFLFLAIVGILFAVIVLIVFLRVDSGDGNAAPTLRRTKHGQQWAKRQTYIDPIIFQPIPGDYGAGEVQSSDIGSQDLGNQSCGNHNFNTQNSGNQSCGNQDSGSQDCGCQDVGNYNSGGN